MAPSENYAVRALLETAVRRLSGIEIAPVVESESFDFMRHYGAWEDAISFQFPVGLNLVNDPQLVKRPLAKRDVAPGNLLLGQLRGRTLPVASARFMQQLMTVLSGVSDVSAYGAK